MRRFFELLAALARHKRISTVKFGQGRHIDKQFLKLRYREDVFLPLAPAPLDVFQSDVAWHAGSQFANRVPYSLGIGQRRAIQLKSRQELVDIDPERIRVVVRERPLEFFRRERHAFD